MNSGYGFILQWHYHHRNSQTRKFYTFLKHLRVSMTIYTPYLYYLITLMLKGKLKFLPLGYITWLPLKRYRYAHLNCRTFNENSQKNFYFVQKGTADIINQCLCRNSVFRNYLFLKNLLRRPSLISEGNQVLRTPKYIFKDKNQLIFFQMCFSNKCIQLQLGIQYS